MVKLSIYIVLLINSFYAAAPDVLIAPEITARFDAVIGREKSPKEGPNTSFRFQQFIKRSQLPLDNQQYLEGAILSLRHLYLSRNALHSPHLKILKKHLGEIHFIRDKLVEAEIRFLNQFQIPGGDALNGENLVQYQAAVNDTTANFSRMVGKITLAEGSVTGTLIPLPIVGGSHQWVVLTCAHAIDCISKKDNSNEVASFVLQGKPPISIRAIKIFKREGRSSRTIAINSDAEIASLTNELDLGALARSLPRYDKDGDVAICYLASTCEGMNTQDFLNGSFPIQKLQFDNNQIRFDINNNGTLNKILFHFVTNQANAEEIVALINAYDKNQAFTLGYAGFNPNVQTLSKARSTGLSLYPLFIGGFNEYHFFHDSPIYQGMSGGPIFCLRPGTPNTIDIYGVVRSLNFGTLPDPHPSRCDGSFLRMSVL